MIERSFEPCLPAGECRKDAALVISTAKASVFELRLTGAVRDQFDHASMRGTDTNLAAAYHASTIRQYTTKGAE